VIQTLSTKSRAINNLEKHIKRGSSPVDPANLRSLANRGSYGWQATRRLSAVAQSAKADLIQLPASHELTTLS